MINVLHKCDDLLVVDKPPNRSVLADRLGGVSLYDELQETYGRLYLVHRLDKGTSGVLAFARRSVVQKALTRAFAQRSVRKFYLGVVVGRFELQGTGVIDLPLRPGRKSRYRVAGPRDAIRRRDRRWLLPVPDQDGHASVTRLRVLGPDGAWTRLLLQPLTGRTHQLRVHLSWIGFPLVGDSLYGRPGDPQQTADRLHLHCHRLVLPQFGSFRAPSNLW
jgi:tRNA pseudouridine32 synthase/23S rRNA pseudouridine746 synthase/23S rRNA pseudouridine1911/1915/1917 synthase